ncbi:metallophosphoesterase [Myxococcus sp. CA051A]|uniref:metallophosphoesterase family protein n=1 Tax=Myxococcus sp. CA051A TaxID=2741739 RepID=UPI00157B8BC1|nr:metallophosphoesterase [Myxococcus sp. CA051A]NTX64315.1 metallophosphoesterase [Myxococcus sp. CA051A]
MAYVEKIISPEIENDECITVDVPEDESELIPRYYRDSPFSRAWLRITTIKKYTPPLFKKWSYAEPPPLPNYTPSLLSRLKGKAIIDGNELRAMDTTIWQVRLRQGTDPEETVIAASSGPAAPITATPILAHGDHILHITDPHFSVGPNRNKHIWRLETEPDDGRPTLAQQILAAVGTKKIGLIVISGDLTFSALEAEFRAASGFIWTLLGRFGIGREHVIVVPGNHDISWTKTETYTEGAKLDVPPAAAIVNYQNFYKAFFGHDPHVTLCMGRRYVLGGNFLVDVCALNSTSLATGKEFLAGVGRIEERGFTEVREGLGWTSESGLALRLLILHHHLVPIENMLHEAEYYRGFGMALDAPRIQRLASAAGVRLALHGHRHQPFLWQSEVYELPNIDLRGEHLGRMTVVGGGTAGSVDTPDQFAHFNLLRIGAGSIELHPFRARPGSAFDPAPLWRAPVSLDKVSGRLCIGIWARTDRAQE